MISASGLRNGLMRFISKLFDIDEYLELVASYL
jgi:hypothetical protein